MTGYRHWVGYEESCMAKPVFTFTNNKIYGGGSLVSAPSDADYVLNASGNEIYGMKDLIYTRGTSEQEFLERIGLREGVSFDLINQTLSKLNSMPSASDLDKAVVVEKSGLKEWLAVGATVASLTKNLVDVISQMLGK